MSWKKNVFSYLMWFVYASLVAAAMVSLGSLYCKKAGIAFYWGILFVVVYIGLIGGIVYLLRRLAPRYTSLAGKCKWILLAAEFALVVVFLAFGVVYRMRGMEGILQSSEYYEAAKIVAGQGIPQIVHGAVYFYLQVLRETFYLLGNRFMAGIWLQMVLQLLGSLFLFFSVRKLAGRIAALTVLGFCMCAPFQVQEALVLSPEMLYFCIFAFSAFLIAAGKQEGKKPVLILLTSILAAICCYIDGIGILLLFLALLEVLNYKSGETDSGWKKEPILFGVAVLVLFVLGFLLCAFSDASLSGKSFEGVVGAWFRLYYPGNFHLPVTIGSIGYELENLVLFGIMVFGVFSFWADRKRERISPCVVVTGLLMLGMCYGVLTEEMPGFHYLYLMLTLLAGIGLGQCFCPVSAVETEKKEGAEGDTAGKDGAEEKPKEAEGKTEEGEKPGPEEKLKEETKPESEEKLKEETKPESEEKLKEETKPEPEEKLKEETKPEAEEKAKQAVESETVEKPREEEKAEAEDRPTTAAEPEVKDEQKTIAESEAKDEPKVIAEPEAKDEPKTITEPEAKDEPKAAVETEDKNEPNATAELETGEKPREESLKAVMEEQAEGKPEKTEEKSNEVLSELEREKALKEEFRQETARRKEEQELEEGKKQVKYIENPLPLPKKHVKRVMEYSKQISEGDDFDHPVSENDDFDI